MKFQFSYDLLINPNAFKIMNSLRLSILLLFIFGGMYAQALDFKNLEDRMLQPAVYFEPSSQSLFIDIQRIGNRLIAVGERGNIIYSDDLGKNWSEASVPVSVLLTAVYFPDAQHGWAVGHAGIILHSSDAGATWVKQFDGHKANQMTLDTLKAQEAALKSEYDLAGEDERADLEYAIEDLSFAIDDAQADIQIGASKPLLDVWFKDAREGYVVGAYGFFFHTTDGGNTWAYAADRLENIDRYHLNAMSELRGGTLMIVGEAGQMFASYDSGESWETLFGPYQGSLFGLQPTDQADEVIVYGLRGHAFKSQDAGASWQKLDVPVETTLTSSAYDSGNLVLVGFSGVILKSQDRGESFTLEQVNRFDAYNAVTYLSASDLLLAGDSGLKAINR